MINEYKKELEVAALENGTVIDHIPSDRLFKVVSLLGLEKLDKSITIGNNLISHKIGKKGIIKIADTFFKEEELNKIALIAPNVKINVIKGYKVTEKKPVTLPDRIVGIIRCGNPKCITNNEPMKTVFDVIDKERVEVKCKYCERAMGKDSIEII
ncbi:MAG: aspartate carbamoyltransferase regulatory subunit [Coprobacter sp.]|nr:aspartate carbamoyltransferase regulatory subunit [Coprobacter sp.]